MPVRNNRTPHSSGPDLRTMAPQLTDDLRARIKLVSLVVLLIVYHNSLCGPRLFLLRSSLVLPGASPWRRLLLSNDDSSFLYMTSYTREAFNMLLEDLFNMRRNRRRLIYCRKRRGRPPLLAPEDQLGLVLFNFGSTMQLKFLCMIFGITPLVCSHVMRHMLKHIVSTLRWHPWSRVRFPDEEKMREYASMVQAREPSVDDVIGFMDGVSLPSECTDERVEQNAFYCGYDSDTMVNNVFAYGPDGKVFFAAVNFSGSWADGALTARISASIRS